MAFASNLTLTYNTPGDAAFNAVRINDEDKRVAVLANGNEIVMEIKHEEKKRERHVVKWTMTIPATATNPPVVLSTHTVIDQALAPLSNDGEAIKLVAMGTAWVAGNLPALLRGEY